MPENKGSDLRTLAVRVSPDFHAQLSMVMIASILLAWLKLLALDGDLAKAEPKTLRSVN